MYNLFLYFAENVSTNYDANTQVKLDCAAESTHILQYWQFVRVVNATTTVSTLQQQQQHNNQQQQ